MYKFVEIHQSCVKPVISLTHVSASLLNDNTTSATPVVVLNFFNYLQEERRRFVFNVLKFECSTDLFVTYHRQQIYVVREVYNEKLKKVRKCSESSRNVNNSSWFKITLKS